MKCFRNYFVGSALLTLLAAIIFRSYLNVTAFSLIPLLMAFAMLWESFRCEMMMEFMSKKFSKDYNSKGFYTTSEDKYGEFWRELREKVFLIFIPLTLPLILFFEDPFKASATGVVMFLPHAALILFSVQNVRRAARLTLEQKQAQEAALREQEKRESMGQWK